MEKIKVNYPINDLVNSLRPLLRTYPSMQRSAAIGGWGLQSSNGSYMDGWTLDFCPYNCPNNIGPTWTPATLKESHMVPIQQFANPTEISNLELDQLFERLSNYGLSPRKARIIKLSKQTECSWHQDGSEKFYQVRLHIPLVTNKNCFFETANERYHMKADGSFYFVHVNQLHRVVNYGDQDRYHFVCHIWDIKNFTKEHRYNVEKNLGETFHVNN